MIEVQLASKNREKALQYLCANGLLSPSDPYCAMVADLVMSEDITLICYQNADVTVRVLFTG